MINVQVRIKRIPSSAADFELVETDVPRLTNGGILCRARWLSVDPFVCAPLEGARVTELPKLGDVVPALGVWDVIESRHDVFSVGQAVVLESGLQMLCATDARHAAHLHPGQTPASTALGILGPPGMAAYFGLLDLAQLRPDETVLVSAASNAVGAMAGQLAILKGARAIGIAGTREKCDWATRHARFAACINYRAESLSSRLKQLAPRGVDVYFDNAGGEVLEAILAGHHVAPGGRIVLNSVRHVDPGALLTRVGYPPGADGIRFLRMDVRKYEHRRGEFLRDAIAWHGAGRLVCKDDVVQGLDNAPLLLYKAMRGENFGRPMIRI